MFNTITTRQFVLGTSSTEQRTMSKLSFLIVTVLLQSTTISARHQPCPSEWVTYKGSSFCYRAGVRPTTKWSEARKACFAMGGDLVKIRSARENRFVALLGRTYSTGINDIMWLGLGGDPSNVFSWVDGTTVAGKRYSNWNTGEPNNYKGHAEDCGMMYLRNMKWNDIVCNMPHAMIYVCEKKRV